MKKLDTAALKSTLLTSILIAVTLVFVLLVFSISIAQNEYKKQEIDAYSKQISSSIKHIMRHYTLQYQERAEGIVEASPLKELLEKGDREGLYKMLKRRFALINAKNPNLMIMQINAADGTTFLRVHNPQKYGDTQAKKRAMLHEAYRRKELVVGYESGLSATAYRIIYPIFAESGAYLGNLELGLDPLVLLRTIEEINGFTGMLFLKKEHLNATESRDSILFDGYQLQSPLTQELSMLFELYKEGGVFVDKKAIELNAREYITHLFALKNYRGEECAEFLFFQDSSHNAPLWSSTQILLYLFILLILIIFIFVIYRSITRYQIRLDILYEEQLMEIKKSQDYLQTLFDVSPNIIITTQGNIIDSANEAMLEFFEYKDIESFKKEHSCICDFFLESEGTLKRTSAEDNWIEYMLANPQKNHKVCMLKGVDKHYFEVHAEYIFLEQGKEQSIVVFNDISEVQKLTTRLHDIINSIDNLIFLKDKEFRYLECNEAFARFVGKEREEIIGKSDYELFEKEDADIFRERDRGVIAQNHANYSNEWVHYRDGEQAYLLVFKAPLYDTESRSIGMVGNAVDFTEQKLLEERLLASQHQFELFMSYIPAIIFIKDIEGNIIYANNKTKEYFQQGNLVGLNVDALLDEEEAQRAKAIDALIVKNSKIDIVVSYLNQEQELSYYRMLGFLIEEFEEKKIALMMIDITTEYKAEKEIVRLKSAIERSPMSVVMTDINGVIEYVNENYEKMSGYSAEELLGKNSSIVKSGETSDAEYKEMWSEICSGRIWSNEMKNRAKDGSIFWEQSTIIPSMDETGAIDGFIAFKLEVSEVVALKEELKNKDEIMIAQSRHAAMGEMISMIAHQWRQPLSVIAMDVNNILVDHALDNLDESRLEQSLEDISRQTQHLSKTIDDFRDFFKPNKNRERVLVSDVFLEAMHVVEQSFLVNSIDVVNDFKTQKRVSIFSRELLQVLLNILKNAKEALSESTREHKQILNKIYDNKESVVIEISDNAGGVSEENMEKIFEPYFSTKDEKNGTGLGLYMSKIIVEKHLKGVLSVRNDKDGACFHIELPQR